jgi:hypothetical protein
MNLRELDLTKLNSLTKYPSILTYHEMGAKGMLTDSLTTSFPDDAEILVTEKVDGTNARIIFFADGQYIIGSREELLYARGDLIGNPALGIVAALNEPATHLASLYHHPEPRVTVVYGEVYGGNIGAGAKNYTESKQVGFRLFDMVLFEQSSFDDMMARDQAEIARWRDAGGQRFVDEATLMRNVSDSGGRLLPTPRLGSVAGKDLPKTLEGMYELLAKLCPRTSCALSGANQGKAEGIVIRAADRSAIAKIRFEDYERTLKRKK